MELTEHLKAMDLFLLLKLWFQKLILSQIILFYKFLHLKIQILAFFIVRVNNL